MFQARDIMELPPNDLNNNPHLRGQDARFRSGGENPRLYIEVPPMNVRLMDGVHMVDVTHPDETVTRELLRRDAIVTPEESTRHYGDRDSWARTNNWNYESQLRGRIARQAVAVDHPTIDLTDPPNRAYAHIAAYERAAELMYNFRAVQTRSFPTDGLAPIPGGFLVSRRL